MTRTGFIVIIIGALCIGVLCVNVDGQQQGATSAQGAGDPGTPLPVFGPPPPQTQLEAIASQKATLLIKGYTEMGEVQADDGSRLRVTAVTFTDARQAREQGLVVSIEPRDAESGPVIAYVDADEMDALATALEALARLEADASPMANVEAVYRTHGELEFTNHTSNAGRVVSVRTTQILVPSGQVLQASATFRPARLGEIRQHIQAAKDALAHSREPAGNG